MGGGSGFFVLCWGGGGGGGGGGANAFLKETLSTKATSQQSYKSDTVSLASIPRYVQPGNKATVTPSLCICNMNI